MVIIWKHGERLAMQLWCPKLQDKSCTCEWSLRPAIHGANFLPATRSHDSPINTDSTDRGIPLTKPLSVSGEGENSPRRTAAANDNCKRIWQPGCTQVDCSINLVHSACPLIVRILDGSCWTGLFTNREWTALRLAALVAYNRARSK